MYVEVRCEIVLYFCLDICQNFAGKPEAGAMPRMTLKCQRCDVECGTSPNSLCEACSSTPHINDNDRPSSAIAFSDLALAMQVNEDILLQRLAEILHKRDADGGASDEAAE
jgi:hypothetical protein